MAINDITKLAAAYFEARDTFRAHYRTKPDPFDYDSEDHIRWQIRSDRLVGLSVRAEGVYRAACDEFFAVRETELV